MRAPIGLANELDIAVVAKGVETARQRQFLITSGRPLGERLSARSIAALLRKNIQFSAI